jgi:hypothetical protein
MARKTSPIPNLSGDPSTSGSGRKERHMAFLTVLLTHCGYHEIRGTPEKRTDSLSRHKSL